MTQKEILLTPGPTQVPLRIFQAMTQPTLHHRTEAFKKFFIEAKEGVKWLTRSETDPVFIAGSGTAAMEASLLNLCKKGDQIVILAVGKFGERWIHIAKKLQIESHVMTADVGESIDLEALKAYLESHASVKAVCMQYCETSTTVEVPVKEICDAVKAINDSIITIVDAVSAIATTPIHLDKQKIDILVSAAHKGLMLPPGLALIILNEQAWQIVEKNDVPSLYFDLNLERKALKKDTTSWTPAMNHIVALAESIKMIKEEGEENVYQRHLDLAATARSAFTKMGLKPMTVKYPSAAVSGIYMPEGVDAEKVRNQIFSEFKIGLAGGQDELQGKVIRFGHMGFCSESDLKAGIDALQKTLGKNNAGKS